MDSSDVVRNGRVGGEGMHIDNERESTPQPWIRHAPGRRRIRLSVPSPHTSSILHGVSDTQ
eukprot:5834268-Amphidinium_carterae.3